METRDRDGTTRFAKLPELGSSNFTSPFGVGAGDAKIHVWLCLPPPGRAQFAAAEMNTYSRGTHIGISPYSAASERT